MICINKIRRNLLVIHLAVAGIDKTRISLTLGIIRIKLQEELNDMTIQSIEDLYLRLGYKDPCPKKGKNNKAAIKLRREERAKYNLKPYEIGSKKIYIPGGPITIPIYEYGGIQYSEKW